MLALVNVFSFPPDDSASHFLSCLLSPFLVSFIIPWPTFSYIPHSKESTLAYINNITLNYLLSFKFKHTETHTHMFKHVFKGGKHILRPTAVCVIYCHKVPRPCFCFRCKCNWVNSGAADGGVMALETSAECKAFSFAWLHLLGRLCVTGCVIYLYLCVCKMSCVHTCTLCCVNYITFTLWKRKDIANIHHKCYFGMCFTLISMNLCWATLLKVSNLSSKIKICIQHPHYPHN